MPSTFRILATTGVSMIVLGGCGDAAAPQTATPTTVTGATGTGTPVSTTVAADTTEPTPTIDAADDSLGGFGPPAAADGEFELSGSWTVAGEADLDRRGCWWVAGDGDRGLLIAPPGTAIGRGGDTLVAPDGVVVADGEPLDIAGDVLYGVDSLPGGADGRWGQYTTFCGADRPVVVATTMSRPAETDLRAAVRELTEAGTALFDTDHGCGYGFATGSADERWSLELSPTGFEPIDPGTITLPDDRFSATISVGRHLFANHCDDVMEWFEPVRSPVATWPIVAGSFRHPGGDGSGDCTQGSVSTTLEGAVVDVDGTLVELGPITIENRSFGCFAG